MKRKGRVFTYSGNNFFLLNREAEHYGWNFMGSTWYSGKCLSQPRCQSVHVDYRELEAAASAIDPKEKDGLIMSLSKKLEILQRKLTDSETEHARRLTLGTFSLRWHIQLVLSWCSLFSIGGPEKKFGAAGRRQTGTLSAGEWSKARASTLCKGNTCLTYSQPFSCVFGDNVVVIVCPRYLGSPWAI